MIRYIRCYWVLLGLLSVASSASATQIVVDGQSLVASDSNPGTRDRPLKTIHAAAALAGAGDVVLIRPGLYVEGAIRLTRSGTPTQPIVFEAETPRTVVISGGTPLQGWTKQEYPLLIGPPGRDPKNSERWAGAEYITLRGLVFRDAPGTAVGAGTGWRIEDCVVERANYDGIVPRGDDIVILRTVVQDVGNNGMAAAYAKNILVRDCILRRCNQYPNSPGGNAGACKFLFTQGMRVEDVISYDNMGTGWWFDFDNTDFVISDCTIFGNHAGKALEDGKLMDQPWAATGIWTEANPGPGHIVNNVIYSNVSGGIGILDSKNITVEGNTIVDCGGGIEFRDLNREGKPEDQRVRKIDNDIVRNNRIKAWRSGYAIATSIGEFKKGDRPGDYGVVLDGNAYDPLPHTGLIQWLNRKADTLSEAQQQLGVEMHGSVRAFTFVGPLIPTHSTDEKTLASRDPNRFREVDSEAAERQTIDEALAAAHARTGSKVTLPVFGYTRLRPEQGRWVCEVYDLQARYLRLVLPNAGAKQALERAVTGYAILAPTLLKVRLTQMAPYALEATWIGPGSR